MEAPREQPHRLLEEAGPSQGYDGQSRNIVAQDTEGSHGKIDKQSLSYALRSGLAGGFAGCAAKTVVGPLDRVKILFQASSPQFAKYTGSWLGVFTAVRDINQQDGLRGLFRGHSATLLRVFPYAGIKFLAYEQFRAMIIRTKEQETATRRFLSGSLAGISSVFFTYPLEVIRVRLAYETKGESPRSSLYRICKQIYGEQPRLATSNTSAASTLTLTTQAERASPRSGLTNFYRGFSPTILGMLPYAGTSFLTHDTIGDLLRHPSVAEYTILPGQPPDQRHRSQLKAPAELTSGAIAGLVSQTASYPFEVVRRRMQVGGAVGDGHRLRIAETMQMIWKERGFKGFFVGLTIGYVKVVPMVAVSFYVYERGKWWLGIES